MYVLTCGEIDYLEALRWQRLLVAAHEAGDINDVLLTLTHPPVYTAGRRANTDDHVHRTPTTREIPLVQIDRGGDVTYHGPGQLVVYPIVGLAHAKAVRPYVAALEEAVVATARSFGVCATGATVDRTVTTGHGSGRPRPTQPRTGVWVDNQKLAAIGIKVTGRTTSHGLAFNVDPDLSHYDGIVPCGLHDAEVCSLSSLGVQAELDEVRTRLVAHLGRTLARPLQPASRADLGL